MKISGKIAGGEGYVRKYSVNKGSIGIGFTRGAGEPWRTSRTLFSISKHRPYFDCDEEDGSRLLSLLQV
ncbi:hypothetical protein V6Z11_A03G034600 [Gossypium hirsutum]